MLKRLFLENEVCPVVIPRDRLQHKDGLGLYVVDHALVHDEGDACLGLLHYLIDLKLKVEKVKLIVIKSTFLFLSGGNLALRVLMRLVKVVSMITPNTLLYLSLC